MAETLAEAIAKKRARLDAAEEDLGSHTGTIHGQLQVKLSRVEKLQTELADLLALAGPDMA